MKLNCDSANKMVRQLQADRDSLLRQEQDRMFYSHLADETPEIPEYDFLAYQEKLDSYAKKITTLKHAINQFNVNTTLKSVGLTIDAALVRMAILNHEKQKLNDMRVKMAKTRSTTMRGVSEYKVRNYEADDAMRYYEKICEEITMIQQAINVANLTEPFEVELP